MHKAGYIHGQTDVREVERLEAQAKFCAPWLLRGFDVPPGAQALDLGTGVGAMMGELLARYPSATWTGVDVSEPQLAAARANHPGPTYLLADATRLPFPTATFDRVHASWLLEHVADPLAVVREVRRVLKPGGLCQFTEVDNSTLRTQPAFDDVSAAMQSLNDAQLHAGGDPFVAQKLERLFVEAGFTHVEVQAVELHGHGGNLAFFRDFVDEFAAIFESLDETLPEQERTRFEAAASRLRSLPNLPGAEMRYAPRVGRAKQTAP